MDSIINFIKLPETILTAIGTVAILGVLINWMIKSAIKGNYFLFKMLQQLVLRDPSGVKLRRTSHHQRIIRYWWTVINNLQERMKQAIHQELKSIYEGGEYNPERFISYLSNGYPIESIDFIRYLNHEHMENEAVRRAFGKRFQKWPVPVTALFVKLFSDESERLSEDVIDAWLEAINLDDLFSYSVPGHYFYHELGNSAKTRAIKYLLEHDNNHFIYCDLSFVDDVEIKKKLANMQIERVKRFLDETGSLIGEYKEPLYSPSYYRKSFFLEGYERSNNLEVKIVGYASKWAMSLFGPVHGYVGAYEHKQEDSSAVKFFDSLRVKDRHRAAKILKSLNERGFYNMERVSFAPLIQQLVGETDDLIEARAQDLSSTSLTAHFGYRFFRDLAANRDIYILKRRFIGEPRKLIIFRKSRESQEVEFFGFIDGYNLRGFLHKVIKLDMKGKVSPDALGILQEDFDRDIGNLTYMEM
jgi:hypothetical protein